MNYFSAYLIFINVVAFITMLLDKHSAKHHRRRIPERRLFLYALLFGGIGIWSGMYLLRHKTKHNSFVYGIPAIIGVEAAAFFLLYFHK